MPPRPAPGAVPTSAGTGAMQALAQIQASVPPELKQSLSAHLGRAAAQGGNAQHALQEWLRMNAAAIGAFQRGQQQQQQQQTQQGQNQQQQAQASQQQARPAGAAGGGGGVAAQQILNYLFPAEHANSPEAGLQHLINKLFVADGRGGITQSPIVPQVVQIAKGPYMSQQQRQLLGAAITKGEQRRTGGANPAAGGAGSSPPFGQQQHANAQRAQGQASSPPASAGAATPDRLGTPQQRAGPGTGMDDRQALPLLKNKMNMLDTYLQRADLPAEDRHKAQINQAAVRAQLFSVVQRLQAAQQLAQQQSRQGTPVQGQQPQQQFGQQQQGNGVNAQQQQALAFQRQQNGTPQPATPQQQQLNQAQRLVNPAQLSNNPPNLAFGTPQQPTAPGSIAPGSIAPNATTIAPSALGQTPAAATTRVSTPTASTAATPGGNNLSVSTPAPSGSNAASTSAAPAAAAVVVQAPAPRQSSDPRPDPGGRMVTKRKLRDLLAGIDDGDRLVDSAEDLLQDVADEFVKSVCTFACRLAKHRGSERLEVRDIAFHLGEFAMA